MILAFILGSLLLICFVILVIFWCKKAVSDEKAFAMFLTTLSLSMGLSCICGGIGLCVGAKDSYNEMLTEKHFIEENYNSQDILTSLEVSNRYFQYQFKLANMKKDKKESFLTSQYLFYDIDALNLDIGD